MIMIVILIVFLSVQQIQMLILCFDIVMRKKLLIKGKVDFISFLVMTADRVLDVGGQGQVGDRAVGGQIQIDSIGSILISHISSSFPQSWKNLIWIKS